MNIRENQRRPKAIDNLFFYKSILLQVYTILLQVVSTSLFSIFRCVIEGVAHRKLEGRCVIEGVAHRKLSIFVQDLLAYRSFRIKSDCK